MSHSRVSNLFWLVIAGFCRPAGYVEGNELAATLSVGVLTAWQLGLWCMQVAQNAVMALGIVGAGTNNARLAGILRNLASYYYKEPTLLFLVRVAQGLAHMGKGLIGLSPYHTDKQLLSGELRTDWVS